MLAASLACVAGVRREGIGERRARKTRKDRAHIDFPPSLSTACHAGYSVTSLFYFQGRLSLLELWATLGHNVQYAQVQLITSYYVHLPIPPPCCVAKNKKERTGDLSKRSLSPVKSKLNSNWLLYNKKRQINKMALQRTGT